MNSAQWWIFIKIWDGGLHFYFFLVELTKNDPKVFYTMVAYRTTGIEYGYAR